MAREARCRCDGDCERCFTKEVHEKLETSYDKLIPGVQKYIDNFLVCIYEESFDVDGAISVINSSLKSLAEAGFIIQNS